MLRFLSIILFFFASTFTLFSQDFHSSLEAASGQSVVHVGSYDWGACIDRITINTGHLVSPQAIAARDFKVNQILYPKKTNVGMEKGFLPVTDAFASDSQGNRITSPSNFITLLTDVHPLAENSNPFVSISFSSRFKPYYGYKISNKKLGISIQNLKGFVNESAAKFETDEFEYTFPAEQESKSDQKSQEEKVLLNYASYIPQAESSEKIPLILWFHGMGESGSNIYQVLFGTKTTALAEEKIQGSFPNGCAILAPQCPTGWLETTEKGPGNARVWAPVDKDAPANKVKKPINKLLKKLSLEKEKPRKDKVQFAAVSYYTEPVKNLLYIYLENHPQIDRDRIYVGGCSAGGYMTMNMMIEEPQLFAAAFPICEYYLDSKINPSKIEILAKKPLWFTYALNDDSVNPEDNSIPTIVRLNQANAENVHYSEFRNVVDLSGKYLLNPDAKKDDDEYGLPYEYPGHWSWIYVLNNDCRDGNLSLFEWLAKQKLNSKN
ncbi:hypothetical protein DYE50_02840 [Treponema ruminis]|uniref:Putative peptidase n=1 Tax=Treponema ruminis TaxID=744515 RepID=A0A7W8LNA5_9SPIR|nr:prolyl oligopeptidase family serine peptidase [Treponema ruminis]MBB5227255.1 putative peptidase [Treponema ruminis]QSI01516.1 hypothetical protein DYE50_02840 [Treponema ruminis]